MIKLNDLSPFSEAEEKLIAGSASGKRVIVGDGSLPLDADENCEIRAELVRLLLLEEDESLTLHAKGIRLRGAIVVGVLDLQGSNCQHDLTLSQCLIEKAPSLINARLRGLHISGCQCPGLMADNCHFGGSVYLRSGFIATGEISMAGARIGGDLQICDAKIRGKNGSGIFAASLHVDGSIYLGDYPFDEVATELFVEGTIQLSSARIERDFYCRNCSIAASDQGVKLHAYADGGEDGSPIALSLSRSEIGGLLYLRSNQISGGMVNLSGAVARRLNDEPDSEGAAYRIRLDGFEYVGFADGADLNLQARLKWLERRPMGVEFSSQPYEHLASVLNKLGHRNDAQHVLYHKEMKRRAANVETIKASRRELWNVPLLKVSDFLLRNLIGYGYRPLRAAILGVIIILCLAAFFQKTWNSGDMTPNSAPILVSKSWVEATQTHSENPAVFWSSKNQAGQDYETFNALAYSADLLIPIVNLGQEDAWAPSTSRSVWGKQGWWIRWFAKIIGWVITALGAAVITGAIRKI